MLLRRYKRVKPRRRIHSSHGARRKLNAPRSSKFLQPATSAKPWCSPGLLHGSRRRRPQVSELGERAACSNLAGDRGVPVASRRVLRVEGPCTACRPLRNSARRVCICTEQDVRRSGSERLVGRFGNRADRLLPTTPGVLAAPRTAPSPSRRFDIYVQRSAC